MELHGSQAASDLQIFNKHCLKPALDEVNHITDFIVDVMAIKKGRAVEKLVLSWFRKSPAVMRRAHDEREKSRVGRQVRWNRRAGEGVQPAEVMAPPEVSKINFEAPHYLARTQDPRCARAYKRPPCHP